MGCIDHIDTPKEKEPDVIEAVNAKTLGGEDDILLLYTESTASSRPRRQSKGGCRAQEKRHVENYSFFFCSFFLA